MKRLGRLCCALACTLTFPLLAGAADGVRTPPGTPFQALQRQVDALRSELSRLQLTPGPQGAPGPAGPAGAAVGDAVPILWVGGCSRPVACPAGTCSLTTDPFNENLRFCADVVETATNGAYFSVTPDGTITALAAGYYRLDFYSLLSWADVWLMNERPYGEGNPILASPDPGSLAFTFGTIVKLNASERVRIIGFRSGIPFSGAYATGGNRLAVQYLGPLP